MGAAAPKPLGFFILLYKRGRLPHPSPTSSRRRRKPTSPEPQPQPPQPKPSLPPRVGMDPKVIELERFRDPVKDKNIRTDLVGTSDGRLATLIDIAPRDVVKGKDLAPLDKPARHRLMEGFPELSRQAQLQMKTEITLENRRRELEGDEDAGLPSTAVPDES